MLELLRIKNLALIEDLEMEFFSGLNVLTGETGAGKSFILKALHFVTGEKLSADLVRPHAEKATVEALFVINGEDIIIRRELTAESGRSRLYINDQLSSLEAARELRDSLIVHTSQHGQQRLLQPSYQATMLDAFMDRPDLLIQKETLQKKLAALTAEKALLEKNLITLQEKREMLEFQQKEIDAVAPTLGEEEELEIQRDTFRNQADVSDYSSRALGVLYGDDDGAGLYSRFSSLEKTIGRLVALEIPQAEALQSSLSTFLDTKDQLADVEKMLQGLEAYQDIDIEKIESRLFTLAQLKRKLHRPLSAIMSLRQEIEENLSFLDSAELERKRISLEEEEVCDSLAILLTELNDTRKKAATSFTVLLVEELIKLGFSEHVQVFFAFTPHALHATRTDCIEERARLLWKPNPGQPEQPLDKIASGGELSRFLLATVTIMSRRSEDIPVLIFDEVDAGVGGLTLNSVAASLEGLSKTRQLLLITHWPQLAAKASKHFFIQKSISNNQTYTTCLALTGSSITDELARMAGGGEQGNAFARELQ